jgi:hypothetical protein
MTYQDAFHDVKLSIETAVTRMIRECNNTDDFHTQIDSYMRTLYGYHMVHLIAGYFSTHNTVEILFGCGPERVIQLSILVTNPQLRESINVLHGKARFITKQSLTEIIPPQISAEEAYDRAKKALLTFM